MNPARAERNQSQTKAQRRRERSKRFFDNLWRRREDKDLFEFVNTIPSKYLIKNGYAKNLLRTSMNGILNSKVRLDREKKGFNASINSIINFNNKEHIEYILDDSKIFEFVKKDKIESLLKAKEYSNSFKKFLFNFINSKIFISWNYENSN